MRKLWAVLAAAVLTLFCLPASPALAASLQEVTGFGYNPTGLRMYVYVPDTLSSATPPLLVAVHYCTGSGPAFYSGTEFASLADQYGFIVVYPSATRDGACFDVSTAGALTHDGTSDPAGIASMVAYAQATYHTDPARTYVTGASSGGMMTDVLLGDYPDVFAAGAAFMGVPFGCFATTDGSLWNTACATGTVSKTPQQWGDLVRAAYPAYTGTRPRMQLFHGTDDTTLAYPNFGEEIKQWTNVLGVSQTPVTTDTPQTGWTRTRYGSSGDQAPVEAISVAGVGHVLPLTGQARMAIHFFGLDGTVIGPASCHVTSSVSAWNTGLTNNLTVTSTSAVTGWSLGFTLAAGQTITNGWNATYAPASGQVTATNLDYDKTIPAGGSVSIGYQATHTGNSAAPTGFTLNGTTCG